MVKTPDSLKIESKCIRGGNGEVKLTHLLNGADEMYGKGRMFAKMTLDPGCSIGEHYHEGDNEIFYILSGKAKYNDNGTSVELNPGDVAICNSGEMHGMVNETSAPVEFMAAILYN